MLVFHQVKMAARSLPIYRGFTTNLALFEKLNKPLKVDALAEESHHGKAAKLWRNMFFFVGCPAMLLSFVNVMLAEEPPRPEFKKYPHLRIRNKKFPWGDGNKTLFHNPRVNALPDGYEDEL